MEGSIATTPEKTVRDTNLRIVDSFAVEIVGTATLSLPSLYKKTISQTCSGCNLAGVIGFSGDDRPTGRTLGPTDCKPTAVNLESVAPNLGVTELAQSLAVSPIRAKVQATSSAFAGMTGGENN